jgi:hypothetical protein
MGRSLGNSIPLSPTLTHYLARSLGGFRITGMGGKLYKHIRKLKKANQEYATEHLQRHPAWQPDHLA